MSVLVEAFSVIVRCATLETRYAGGVGAYAADCPNQSFCSDGMITRVGFMGTPETDAWIRMLEEAGLRYLEGDHSVDVAVISQTDGFLELCDWLEGGTIEGQGVSLVWLKGRPAGAFAAPPGWTPEQSRGLFHLSQDEVQRRVLYLDASGGVETSLDMDSGQRVYSASNSTPMIPSHAPAPKAVGPLDEINRELRALEEQARKIGPSPIWEVDFAAGRQAYARKRVALHVVKVVAFGFLLGVFLKACGLV